MNEIYRIKMSIGKISLEIESHDKKWVEEKEKSLLGTLISDPKALVKLSELGERKDKDRQDLTEEASLTIQEFHKKYVASGSFTRPTIALFLLYYLEKISKVAAIRTNDVKQAFKQIGFPRYNKINFTDTLNSLKTRGYVNKIGGNWKLTLTGVDYVLDNMIKE